MKLKTKDILIATLIVGLTIGFNTARAQDNTTQNDSTTTNTNTEPRNGDGKIQQVKERIENRIEKNKDIRNAKIEERKDIRVEMKGDIKELRASTTEKLKGIRDERKDIRNEMKGEIRDLKATTTAQFKALKDEKGQIIKKMKADAFEMRKKALIKELDVSINNLVNISGKIQERITMYESKGRDTTKAKSDLAIANDKIAKAKLAIEAFTNIQAPTQQNSTATQDISLDKPRKVGDEAIKSVKDARDALKVVLKTLSDIRPNTATSTEPSSNQ